MQEQHSETVIKDIFINTGLLHEFKHPLIGFLLQTTNGYGCIITTNFSTQGH